VRKGGPVDKPEFDSLFAANFVKVQRYVERRIGDQSAAEEITAETFLLAWNRRARTQITLPWLYQTASHKIADHSKRQRRRQQAEDALLRLEEEAPEAMSMLDRLELHRALHALAPREREAVMLTYWEGLSAAEIGEVLGISEQAVWTTMSRARTKLRGHLVADPMPTEGGDHAER
jgi:RNA polymerase sigma-70 factor (ECF subfamily)